MNSNDPANPARMTAYRLEDRNRAAQRVVDNYAAAHASVDVMIGLAGMIPVPGAAVAALAAAISLQAPVFYQPMSRKLARLYSVPPDQLEAAQDDIVAPGFATTALLDIGADFGVDFMKYIAGEVLAELGIGTGVAMWIPFIGGFIAAGMDATIATKMTNRIGRMIAIYFQNGGAWVGSKAQTHEAAKHMTGTLDDVRKIQPVRESLLRNVREIVSMMRSLASLDQIRAALHSKGIPDDLIDEALGSAF